MKNAIKTFIRKYIDAVMFDTKGERLAEEGIWHHVFRESFRSGGWKNEVGLSMGRWAGGASFFYVLHRILEDVRPKKIVELGLGESTKLISAYGSNEDWLEQHVVIEHSENWITSFASRFETCPATRIQLCGLDGKTDNAPSQPGLKYAGLSDELWSQADLVVVDGPFGSLHNSRSNALDFVSQLESDSPFILLLDDSHRQGEKETLKSISTILKARKIKHHLKEYRGAKSCSIVCSGHYPWLASL